MPLLSVAAGWPPALSACVLLWYGFANLLAFALYGADKRRAKKGLRRVPERTLLGVALLGGALGALLGMRLYHHKTRHPKFTVTVPLLLLGHAALLCWLYLL